MPRSITRDYIDARLDTFGIISRDYVDARLETLGVRCTNSDNICTSYMVAHRAEHMAEALVIDRRIAELVDQVRREQTIRDEALSEAIAKSEASTDHRFESVNEFRAQLADQATNLLGRKEYDAAHQALVDRTLAIGERLTTLESSLAGGEKSRANVGQYYAWALAGLSFLVSVIIVVAQILGHV